MAQVSAAVIPSAQTSSATTSEFTNVRPTGTQASPNVVNPGPEVPQMIKSRRSFDSDVRRLPKTTAKIKPPRPEFEPPDADKYLAGESAPLGAGSAPESSSAPAPAASPSFEGIHFNESCTGGQCGNGHPPDTNGDVGPAYYIQTVNTAIGIYNKSTGTRVAGFTFDNFMSQGSFGNLCDTDNFGDPVVVYDTFADRWIITDFAFQVDSHGNISPQTVYQCFAVSKSGDPVAGGWNYYSILIAGGIDDYPKFGIWPDGLYMSANMFGYSANSSFQNVRVFAFNKAQMYAGAQNIQVVSFDAPASAGGTSVFTLLPSNARAQAGTPPTGRENLFASVWNLTSAVRVWKFHVDWNNTANSSFTGPTDVNTGSTWASAPSTVAESGGNNLDTLATRLMLQNQYTNIGGVESLWDSHTVQGSSSSQAAVRWYQLNVTGGTINTTATQASTWNPDSKSRFMPSLAVDHLGNMAIGYSVSSSSSVPAIRYAGRLTTDAVNTLGQTETSLIEGTGAQTGNCGTSACTRWGDYSAMTLDPDGCTFWYTNEYYVSNGLDDHTRIGSFKFSQCTPLGNGNLEGTVKKVSDNSPIVGATVTVNSDTRTTDTNGFYSFSSYPVGTYSVTASAPGFVSNSAGSVMVNQNATTTQNFTLTAAPTSACLTDTTQADFQAGTGTNVDTTISPGDVKLALISGTESLDQQQTTTSNSGFSSAYLAQTFTAGLTGQLSRADLYVQGGGTLTIQIRTTSSGTPTTTVLGTTTISSPSSAAYTSAVNFSPAVNVTAGTTYALVISNNVGSGTWGICSNGGNNCSSNYSGGNAFTSANGSSWSTTIKDFVFKTYVTNLSNYSTSGTLISSLKDSNPAANATATWTTLSWTASAPANTTVKFQVAASSSASGPFSFIGPDGTTNTFFTTSGASLSQFTGLRYLKYKAYLSTTNSSSTPALNDVTACFSNVQVANTSLAVNSASGTYGGTTNLSATLTSGGNGISGKTISFTVNGSPVGATNTNNTGVASLSNVSLAGINAGAYATGVAASFAGDNAYNSSGGTNSLTVNPASQSITVNTHAPVSAVYNSQFSVAATADSGLAVSYSSSGVCTNNGATFTMTSGTGTCTVLYDQAGNNNYNAASEVMESVTATKASQSITFNALSSKTYGDADFNVSASASSNLAVGFGASGQCTVTGNTVHITGGGNCTITASQAGNSNYNAASPVDRSFTIATAGTSTGVTSSLNPSNSGQQVMFTATVTSGAGVPSGTVQFKDGGNNLGAAASLDNNGQASVSTSSLIAGTHTITANYNGSSNYSTSSGTLAGGQVVHSTNADLAGLSLSAGAISPAFSAATTSYNLNVPNSTTGTTVTPTAADANATITVNNVVVTSGHASGSISLNVGDNTITTVVTAQDQTTTKSYTVTVTRAGVAQIAVEQPPGMNLTSGTSQIDFGGVAPNGNNSRTFIIRNDGSADLTGLNITFDGTNLADFSVTSAPTSPVAPGGNTSFTVKFAPAAAGARSAALHIASNDPNTRSFDVGLTGTGYTYSEAWRLQYFGSIGNSGDGADTNDFDHDGLTNLLEFATASDPTQPSSAPGVLNRNGSNLEFTYTRSDGALSDGILFDVEWSDDLSAWSTQGVTESILSDDGTIQLVKAIVPVDGSVHRFIHLKVTRP